MTEQEEDVPSLSAETFSALQEFYQEQERRESARMEVAEMISRSNGLPNTIDAFEEDWQLSQFWYDDVTAETLAKECAKVNGKIACISCPTLYLALKKRCPCDVKLFEYDKRFARVGEDFVYYDYNSPLDIPRELREQFDLVFADPPFLSDECLTKTAVTVKFLAKDKIILCTGAIMEEMAKRLLCLKICKFVPHHRNKLQNEFRCFANYDLDSSIGS